jgi:hypothetical protein
MFGRIRIIKILRIIMIIIIIIIIRPKKIYVCILSHVQKI